MAVSPCSAATAYRAASTSPEGGPNNFGLNGTTCTTGMIKLNWGQTVLKWFEDHPKHP